jgi:hypothetical protein
MALLSKENILKFVFAGKAIFTVENPATGNRFTYKVRCVENDDGSQSPFFVSVLTGPDNWDNYRYIGFVSLKDCKFRHGHKSGIGPDAPSVKAFRWFIDHIEDDRMNVYHEGRCGKCARRLTVPSSIEIGFGPKCLGGVA